nr:transposase, MuDR, MULE transposase domain protein [Tanacetum cinerariifolium]
MVRRQFWHIRAHSDPFPDIGVLYGTYPNLFTIKIHHDGEFFKPPERRYKFALLDYADLVDSDMFSLYELSRMLKEVSLRKCVGNGMVIEEIIEDNVVSSSGEDSRLLMVEWSVVEPMNDENVGCLYCDNEVPMGNPFSFSNLLEGFDVKIDNVDPYHIIDEEQKIAEMVAELNHLGEEVIFQTSGAQDIDEEVVEREENVDEE